jgi:hypothetical protein
MIRVATSCQPNAAGQEEVAAGVRVRRTGQQDQHCHCSVLNLFSKANDWNQLEFILDMNILRGFINDGNGPGGATDGAEFGAMRFM